MPHYYPVYWPSNPEKMLLLTAPTAISDAPLEDTAHLLIELQAKAEGAGYCPICYRSIIVREIRHD